MRIEENGIAIEYSLTIDVHTYMVPARLLSWRRQVLFTIIHLTSPSVERNNECFTSTEHGLQTLFERQKEAERFHEHLEIWLISTDKNKAFIRQCLTTLLLDLKTKPRVRTDNRMPQFHDAAVSYGNQPSGGKRIVQELLLRRVTLDGRETQVVRNQTCSSQEARTDAFR